MTRIRTVAAGLALVLAPAMLNPAAASADQITWPGGTAKPIDIVIQRALSQRGVPYVYGGGDVNGPTNGIRPGSKTLPGIQPTTPGLQPGTQTGTQPGLGTTFPGAAAPTVPGVTGLPGTLGGTPSATAGTTVGFDSSGLIQYAFAGAGIKMPRTSGEQCNVGRKVPPALARPGDLICYGPGGSQSVALFLGNGQMIEGTEPVVTVSPARTTNMTPYLTRIIES